MQELQTAKTRVSLVRLMSSPALRTEEVSLRDALPADHDALQSLDGTAPDAGAALIQARRNFFARPAAYSRCRTFVAEQDGQIVGMNCVALTSVRVAGRPCSAGYSFNTRVAASMRGRGLGSLLMRAGADWVEKQGAPYLTGFIGVNNVASMAMVTSLGWEPVARFDYLVLDLARFAPDPEVKIRKVDALGDPAHAGLALRRGVPPPLRAALPRLRSLPALPEGTVHGEPHRLRSGRAARGSRCGTTGPGAASTRSGSGPSRPTTSP